MAKGGAGGRKKGGRSGGTSSGSRGGTKESGIEKYGQDEVEEFMNIDAGDDDPSDAESEVEEENDILKLDDGDDEEWAAPKKAAKKQEVAGDSEEEERRLEPGSKGWRKDDFYGGDDAGDNSESDSDEAFVFEEAKRLEELRAQQLEGGEDVLASLLAIPGEAAPAKSSSKSAPSAASTGAIFESVFSGEAEKVSTAGDMSELPAAQRKQLLKKEAPELMPLLSDFKAKLAVLRETLPLLQPEALKRLPASGANYLEAKAGLLLSTLANLSFYLLLRAEGGTVRSHPVITQLVWLRELHEKLAPLDGKLGKKMRKALSAAAQIQTNVEPSIDPEKAKALAALLQRQGADNGSRAVAPPKTSRKKTLRERLERLELAQPTERVSAVKQDLAPLVSKGRITKDLLRLPKAKNAANANSATAGLDLDDVDPSLGIWAPKTSLGDELASVQQQLGEHAKRAKAANESADQLTEPRVRKARDRKDNLHEEPKSDEEPPAELDADEDEDEAPILQAARKLAKSKKEKRAQVEAERANIKEEARRLKEFKPDDLIDGQRKATKQILKNRGLVRIRKKKAGNARVANRGKFKEAVKKRKGAVQDMQEGAEDGATYQGEETGIRTHLKKSLKLG